MKAARPIFVLAILLFVGGADVAQTTPAVVDTAAAAQTAPQPEIAIDQIKETVVFLETSWPNAQPIVGTGFLVFTIVSELGKDDHGNDQGLDFLVTAKHMIRQTLPNGQPGPYAKKTAVRFNTVDAVDRSGRHWDSFDSDILDARGDLAWFVDSSDPAADVALTPIFLNKNVDFKTIGTDSLATKSIVADQHVNENDEVLFTGLFTGFFGALKNYPIVRHGHLALLPGEDIAADQARPDKKTQIYLAEVTSFGGNSGSPVFVRIGPLREGLSINMNLGYRYYLLGVMRGFYSDDEAKQNTGIAVIVPSDKISEILSSGPIKAFVAKAIGDNDVRKGDLKAAEAKFLESIDILEKEAPESSQLATTLLDYASMLQRANRGDDARSASARALKIAGQPVSKPPEP